MSAVAEYVILTQTVCQLTVRISRVASVILTQLCQYGYSSVEYVVSADATDPLVSYSSVVSTLCQPMRQYPPLCQYDRGYSSVVSTLCQPMQQIHRCVSMTEATQL